MVHEDSIVRSNLKFNGVWKRKWGRWVFEIRLPNSCWRIWLRSYDSVEKASHAFDTAVFCLHGSAAKFNFPGSPPDIPGGDSLTPPEIQAAAARFANSVAAPGIEELPSDFQGMQFPPVESEELNLHQFLAQR